MEAFCRITMQLSLFELKLKTFPLLHRREHFVFTRKFLSEYLMQSPLVKYHAEYDATLNIIMRLKFIFIETAVKLTKVSAAFKIRMASL